MAHHGWVDVLDRTTLTPASLKSPFGRLFAARNHSYNSHAIALFAGGLGPIQNSVQTSLRAAAPAAPVAAPKPANPAGFTFLGQFIDHDATEFRVIDADFALIQQNPTIGQRQMVLEDAMSLNRAGIPTTTNGRSGLLDLDSVYGLLGVVQADLFTADGQFALKDDEDIQRGSAFRNGRLIADPRNDENKLIVQIHVLFERLHNKVHATKPGGPEDKGPGSAAFAETRAEVIEAYHRIVLHDYLPRVVQAEHLLAVLAKLKTEDTRYQAMNKRNRALLAELGIPPAEAAKAVAMPVEFSHAAFRLGHSQLRNGYLLRIDAGTPFGAVLFNTGQGQPDLRGNAALNPGSGAPNFVVDWKHFFKVDADDPQNGEGIDGVLPDAIFRLPPPAIGEPPVSLAERNIRRGVDFGLPSGQEVAAEFATTYGYVKPMTLEEAFPAGVFGKVAEVLEVGPNLQWETPLWYYIIAEAGAFADGPQLGPVGGLIVAETLLGAIVEYRVCLPGARGLAAVVSAIEAAYAALPPSAGDQTSGPLAWDKTPTSVADVFTMGQLVRFVEDTTTAAPTASRADAVPAE